MLYEVHKKTWSGKGVPRGRGLYTFDELKVRGGMTLNVKNELADGLCATSEQLYSLEDVYSHCRQGGAIPCNYIMLGQWRCNDSDFDMPGPLLSSEKGLNYLKIHKFFWATIDRLQETGFSVELSVCDGASYNLKFICFNCVITVLHAPH